MPVRVYGTKAVDAKAARLAAITAELRQLLPTLAPLPRLRYPADDRWNARRSDARWVAWLRSHRYAIPLPPSSTATTP